MGPGVTDPVYEGMGPGAAGSLSNGVWAILRIESVTNILGIFQVDSVCQMIAIDHLKLII